VAIANALQLEATRRRVSRSGLFLAKCLLRLRKSCYFTASVQNCDIAPRFSDPDFLKESNNLAIIRRFHTVILTFDPLTLNVCVNWASVIKLGTKFERNRTNCD